MELVIDANIIIASLISKSGKTAEMLFSDKLKLYSPEYLLYEIGKYKKEISEKSGLSIDEINILFSLMSSNISLISFSEFKEFVKKASEICPDPNDIEYFALALKLNCPLWSNDRLLKKSSLKVLTTSELAKLL